MRRASRDHADAARKRRTLAKRAQRFVLQLPIRFREKGEETWHEGTTLNISESGVLFQAACRLRPQATIEMALTLPSAISGEAPGQILCQGLVVRSVSGSEAEGMHRLSAAISRFKFARAKPARGTAARA
ncbi:MAG: PilZ domain-containing protein [Terriglobia bacterium]